MVLHKGQLESKLLEEKKLIRQGVLRDENPLDTSTKFHDFLEACRRGDLATCQQMISDGININARDQFDYTPLIIASLCGHYDLCRLLLESGALAERNTFQGERCVYGALNDQIRNLLLQYDFSTSMDPLQPWFSHIQSLMSRTSPPTSDITLTAGATSFHLHKFLLSARSPYFGKRLDDSPGTSSWKLPDKIPVESSRSVLRYLYLGEAPKELVDPGSTATEEEVLKGVDKISKHLQVEQIWNLFLTGYEDRRLVRQRYQDELERAQTQLESFYSRKVLGRRMSVDIEKADKVEWRRDNSIFADVILRADEALAANGGNTIPIGPSSPQTNRAVLYPCHKAMLIRIPYFEVMFNSIFIEAQESEHLRIVKVDCSPEVLEVILQFLYTEKFSCPLEHALDLLYVADMWLDDRLKTKAAGAIATLGSGKRSVWADRTHKTHASDPEQVVEAEPLNIYDVIRAAWDLKVQRLEEFAGRYLAYRLEDYINEPEFADMIAESAARIKKREETDSIELLDDIRHYLSERFRMRFEDAGLDEMMAEEAVGAAQRDVEAGELLEDAANQGTISTDPQPEVNTKNVKTLDGSMVEDEFDSDAQNYAILLLKIERLLDKLKLDA